MQELHMQGRIVRGHPAVKRQVLDDFGKPKLNDAGQPREQIYFGLAIDKAKFMQQYFPYFEQEARVAFPNGVPPNFAYKFVDGDALDSEGKPYNRFEGYSGHFVVNFSTEGFPPPIYKADQSAVGGYRQLSEQEINCGDYVAVKATLVWNKNTGGARKAGLYVNPIALLHEGYGQKIVTASIDPKEAFAGFQSQLPAGASATPLMSNAPMPTAMQPAAPQYAPAPAAPQYAPAPAAPQYAPAPAAPQYAPAPAAPQYAPAHDFVNNAIGQPMPGMPVGR